MNELKHAVVPIDLQSFCLEGTLALWVPALENDSEDDSEAIETADDNEKLFKKECVAYDAGVYTSNRSKGSQTLRWSIFQNRTLTIFDVSLNSKKEPLSKFNVKIHFPSNVMKDGVAFSFSEHSDTTIIYAITHARVLYYIRLSKTWFQLPDARLDDDWCLCYRPISFLNQKPDLMAAISTSEICVSFFNGGLTKIILNPKDASHYEQHIDDSSYLFSLKKYLSLQAFKADYRSPNTIISMIFLSTYNVLVMLSLDYKLKVLDLSTNQCVETIELSQTILPLQSFPYLTSDHTTNSFIALYYPDNSHGSFSIYKLDANAHSFKLNVVIEKGIIPPSLPDDEFIPWMLSDFQLISSEGSQSKFLLIIAWKSNLNTVIQKCNLSLDQDESFSCVWSHSLDSFSLIEKTFFDVPTNMSSGDISEIWLQHIFAHNTSIESIQVALLSFQNSSSQVSKNKLDKFGALTISELKNAVLSSIVSTIQIEPNSDLTGYDYYEYKRLLYNEWERFAKLVAYLDHFGDEILSINFDPSNAVTYINYANKVAFIRDPYLIESFDEEPLTKLISSLETDDPSLIEGYQILDLGRSLHSCMSFSTLSEIRYSLRELVQDLPSYSLFDTLWVFYDKHIYPNVDPDYISTLIDTLVSLENPMRDIDSLIQRLRSFDIYNHSAQSPSLFLCASVARVLDSILKKFQVSIEGFIFLLSLITSQQDYELQSKFAGCDKLFLSLLEDWRLVSFLLENSALLLEKFEEEDVDSTNCNLNTMKALASVNTALQFFSALNYSECFSESQISPLHATVISSLSAIFIRDDTENDLVTELVEKLFLFKQYNACMQLIGWLKSDPIAVYLKALIYLKSKEAVKAVRCFKTTSLVLYSHTSQFAVLREFQEIAEKYHHQNLLSCYYLHLSKKLFEESAYIDALEFSLLADASKETDDEDLSIAITHETLKTACAAGKFDAAHVALMVLSTTPLKKSCLLDFVNQLTKQGKINQLLNYSMPTLRQDVDNLLERKAFQMINVESQPCWYNILFSWRYKHQNYRDAAAIIYEKLSRYISTTELIGKKERTFIIEHYLIVLNTLELLPKEDTWILVTDMSVDKEPDPNFLPQKLLTLDAIVAEYHLQLKDVAVQVTAEMSSAMNIDL